MCLLPCWVRAQIDRLYQWQSNPHADIVNQLKKQKPNTKLEFQERVDQVKLQFSEQVATSGPGTAPPPAPARPRPRHGPGTAPPPALH